MTSREETIGWGKFLIINKVSMTDVTHKRDSHQTIDYTKVINSL